MDVQTVAEYNLDIEWLRQRWLQTLETNVQPSYVRELNDRAQSLRSRRDEVAVQVGSQVTGRIFAFTLYAGNQSFKAKVHGFDSESTRLHVENLDILSQQIDTEMIRSTMLDLLAPLDGSKGLGRQALFRIVDLSAPIEYWRLVDTD